MPDRTRLMYLYTLYIAHLASREEVKAFIELLDEAGDTEMIKKLSCVFPDSYFEDEPIEDVNEQAMIKAIWQNVNMQDRIPTLRIIQPIKASIIRKVAALLILAAGTLVWRYYNRVSSITQQQVPVLAPAKKPASDRYIVLPDSSIAIVRINSQLHYPGQFEHDSRTVDLSGEAYFNIRKDTKRPFIIHSGKLTTTVWGTSFIIKAYPEQKAVTVTVSSGKVKITDGQKLRVVIGQNQQFVYHLDTAGADWLNVPADSTAGWLKEALYFKEQSFYEIAAKLNERYQVHIRFASPATAAYQLSIIFKGTETLETVLSALCAASQSKYTIRGTDIVVSGNN